MNAAKVDPRDTRPIAEREHLLALALEMTDLCARSIAHETGAGLDIERKADKSIVTSADRAAEQAFREAIATRHPEAGVLGEEFPPSRPGADFRWVIDPIDGTAEFARRMPLWGIIIGLYFRDEPLVGVIDHPDLEQRLWAGYGLGAFLDARPVHIEADLEASALGADYRLGLPSRHAFTRYADQGDIFERLTREFPNCRTFHSCYAHSAVVSGQLDVTVEWDANPWDLAAARILSEEAGGAYQLLGSREVAPGKFVHSAAFGVPALVDRVARVVADAVGPN